MRGHTVAIEHVAKSIESISRNIAPRGDIGPTIITNPAPDRYQPNKSMAFNIDAILGGTSVTDPLHIQVQQAVIRQMPGSDFLVPANQIMSSLNPTPINGISEYRVRGNIEK